LLFGALTSVLSQRERRYWEDSLALRERVRVRAVDS
jgi:hypothetical protein